MTLAAALFTIAIGGVLALAVAADVAGIDLQGVGYIRLAGATLRVVRVR
jgi:hypothetical protein